MNKNLRIWLSAATVALTAVLFVQCAPKEKVFKVQFDSSKEVSGQKFALRDINPDLPEDWNGYNFVVLEFRSSTPQRFQLGFTTKYGYNELRIVSYVPNAWNRLAIPLKYYTDEPDPALDLAALNNMPRYTGWVNLGGRRGPLEGVDSIGVRMRRPINNPTIEIRSVTLATEDPGDLYMGDVPAVDEFGQSNLVDYPEKAHSLADLQADWDAEESETVSTEPFNYSKYGGYRQKQVRATGYFRTEKIDGKWWFVDPEGYLFLSVGVDGVRAGNGGSVFNPDRREGMYKELPPAEIMEKFAPQNGTAPNLSFGLWNLYRRYGDDYPEKSKEMIIKRMDKWGVNTLGNWSSPDIIAMNRKAFLLQLRDIGIVHELMGLVDVYDPNFKANVGRTISAFVAPYRTNPWLVGYFIGNEPAWLGEEARLCGLILDGPDRPIKAALQKYLAKNGDTPETRTDFVYDTFRTFLQTTNSLLKKYDPNHLNLGIRFGNVATVDERLLKICSGVFDVLSFNCYYLYPPADMLDRALEITGLPMIIGEYHFGTVDRGLAQSLWQVESQEQRGVAYRYYTEKGYSHPGLIGTGYFQWSDQDITGRRDGENYNCGLVDVTDRPYREQVEAMMETAKRLYDVHAGNVEPFDEAPVNSRGHGQIPDLWNE